MEGAHPLVAKIQTGGEGVAPFRVEILLQPVAGAIVDLIDPYLKGIGASTFVYSRDFGRFFHGDAVPFHTVFQGVHRHHDREIASQFLLDALDDVHHDSGSVLKAVATILICT